MAASPIPTSSSSGSTQDSSAATGKKSRQSSSKSQTSEIKSDETKKKSKTIFTRFRHSLKKPSKSKSTATSEIVSSSGDIPEIPVSRDAIPSISHTGKASPETLQIMLLQVQTTLAVIKTLGEKLSSEKPIKSLDDLDEAMTLFFENKQAEFKLSEDDSTVVTPRGMIKHVITPFQQSKQDLSPLEAIHQSIRSAFDNQQINLSYNAPDWMGPVIENNEMFQGIGNCESIEALTEEQAEFLQKIYLQITPEEMETLTPIASPRSLAQNPNA